MVATFFFSKETANENLYFTFQDGVDSANLGAAYRAKHGYDCLQSNLNTKQSTLQTNPTVSTQSKENSTIQNGKPTQQEMSSSQSKCTTTDQNDETTTNPPSNEINNPTPQQNYNIAEESSSDNTKDQEVSENQPLERSKDVDYQSSEVVDPTCGEDKKHDVTRVPISFFQSTASAPSAKLLCTPYPDASKVNQARNDNFFQKGIPTVSSIIIKTERRKQK